MPPITDVVKHLLFINVIVFLCTDIAFQQYNLKDYMVLFPLGSEEFKPYQLVTNMFAHADLRHIFFNLFGLFIFGPIIESTLGPKRFLFLYLSAGIAGSILGGMLTHGVILGASGALYGIMVSFALMYPNVKLMIFPLPFEVKAIVLIGLYILYDLFAGVGALNTGIAHFAHLGGAAMGAFLTYKWGLVNFKF